MTPYRQAYDRAVSDPESFWLETARQLAWYTCPQQALGTDEAGRERWFPDGRLNTCHLAVDCHVDAGYGDRTALIYDSPVTGREEHFSYRELQDQVARTAGMLAAEGVGVGDRVVIYMPMIPQAVFAMLACARIGAVHSVVFGGFAAHELAIRIDDAAPVAVLSATCGLEGARVVPYETLLHEALAAAKHRPASVIVWERPEAPLEDDSLARWQDLIARAEPAPCIPVAATHPLYILYTSGTTGKPKGIVRDNGGHAVAMHYSMGALYGMEPGEVFFAASDVGWVVGHSYIVYGPLIAGCTSILFEGKPIGTPDAGTFWRVAEAHRVKVLFAAPTAFRAIRKVDPEGALCGKYDLGKLESIFAAGERLDPGTASWLTEVTGKPVIDHWWQTETGWAIAGAPVGLGVPAAATTGSGVPLPGFRVSILDAHGEPVGPDQNGFIAIERPLPPGCLVTVWNDETRCQASYYERFPGFYVSGDGGYRDGDGNLHVMGRIDDVINVAGHRLSTGEMEEVVASHAAIAECAVIGVQDDLKGQVPVALVVPKDGNTLSAEALQDEVVALVRHEIGPITCLSRVLLVERLPKTRSGKILRATLRQIADGEQYHAPSTIDDPTILDEIHDQLLREGSDG